MRVERDGELRRGEAIDLSDWSVAAGEVARAVRGSDEGIRVECPDPAPVHDHVGVIEDGMAFRPKVALAAAARSRGLTAPEDERRQAVETELSEFDVPEIDLADARRQVAAADEEVEALRERVATLQGRVQALRETDLDADDVEAELAEAVRELSEVETERVAAGQTLERAREQARTARDRQAERLALEDRAANLARAARRRLVTDLHGEFAAAVETVPGPGTAGDQPGEFAGQPATAALAVARLADLDAPVVLDAGRFESADAAARCLGAPVIVV
jgi:hypothetical protein